MIYLEFFDGQGLGNQLWNYVTLRSICKLLNYEFQILNPEKFKGNEFLDIKKFSLNKLNKNILIENTFSEKIFYDNDLNTYCSDFDSNILKINSGTILKGLFQSEKYFFNFDINNFIKLKKSNLIEEKINPHLCIINIRGGEYKRFKDLILPKSYWLDAISNMKKYNSKIEFAIVTDDYSYAKRLLPEYQIIKGSISEDFKRLYKAKYLIVSNSSFAYFPSSLGIKTKKIIAPAHWGRFNNKYKRWASPANFYKGWDYQNNKGEIISSDQINEDIKNTRLIYSNFNILTNSDSIKKNKLLSFLPKRFRKYLKLFLSKIFPMRIG